MVLRQAGALLLSLKDPPSTVALTYHAPSVAKRFDTTAEELKPLLAQFDFIIH